MEIIPCKYGNTLAKRTLQEGRLKQIQNHILQNLLVHSSSRYCLLSKLETISKELELHSEIIRNGYAKPRKDKKDKDREKFDGPRKSIRKDRKGFVSFRHHLPGLARTTSIRTRNEINPKFNTSTKRLSSGSVLAERHVAAKPPPDINRKSCHTKLLHYIIFELGCHGSNLLLIFKVSRTPGFFRTFSFYIFI